MKKLITKETVAEVNDMLKQPEVRFEPCEIFNGFCVRLGNVVIRKVGNSSIIELDPSVRKETFDLWKKDVGKYLSKDLYHGVYSNLFELITSNKKALLRKIPQNELPDIRLEGFDHVYIGDYHYTIIRVISSESNYSDFDRNNENTDEDDYTQFSSISVYNKNDRVTEEEEMQQGIVLFSDNEVSSDDMLEPIDNFDEISDETSDESSEDDINND